MARFEAVALGCLALMIVVALLFARSGTGRRRVRKPGEELSGADVSLFTVSQRHPDHQPQGHGHSHHDGSGHGNGHGGHTGVDAGHAGVDASHAGTDGGGGGVH